MKMKLVLILLLELIVLTRADARTVDRVELTLDDGSKHHALLSFPEKARRLLPVFIVLVRFDTGEKSISLLPDDPNVVYATTDYPYKSPHERSFVKDLKQVPQIKKAVHRA